MWNILRKHVESTSQKSSTLKPNTTSTNRTSSIIAKTSSIDYEDNDDDDDNDDYDIDPDIHTDNMRSLDVHTILSGCKGWPSDASCVVYHRLEGLICVGTFGGAIFVYGDGFQLVRSWLTDNPIEVAFMVVVYPNKLFVTFSDNSAQLLELPSLTLLALLGSNWITNRNEKITTVYVDEAGQLPFAFVGTSEGVVSVLDLSGPFSIRLCDYVISWKTIGLKFAYEVTDIQIYPKDEKYLAISYDSITSSAGHVVIFDLTKQKPYRSYDTTNAIVSLAWQHQGDMLFAATKSGKVLSLGVEKTQESSASLWRAAQELVDGDNNDEEEEQVCIKKVTWVAPQPPSTEGCLFVLLGSKGVDDDDDLKNIIVGLSPNNGNLNDLQLVFALPPLSFEKVLSFNVIPSCDKGETSSSLDDGDGDNKDNYVPVITPALLLFTSKSNDNDDDDDDEEKKPLRQLKLVRCPVTDMSQWALEVGTLMDPRPAVEVCSSTSRITFMTGFVPEHSALSLSTALMAKATQHEGSIVQQSTTTTTIYDSDEDNAKDSDKNMKVSQQQQQVKGKRLSARDFLSIHIQELEEQLNQQTNNWEVVLATGVHQDNLHDASTSRLQDIVINGHENGSIIIWGTSLTKRDPSNCAGKGSIWRPLTSLSCGRAGISHISHDETAGLLLAADESGVVVIWSIVGEDGSSLSVLQKCKVEAMSEGKVYACEHFQDKYTDNKKFPVDHDDQESTDYDLLKFIDHKSEDTVETMMKKYPLHSSKKFDNLQEILRIKLNRRVTATLLLSSFLQVFIGTEDGKLFTCPNLSSNEFKEIVHAHRPTHFATAGSIISLQFGNFYHTEQILVPAVYVVYSSGLATVIQLNTLQLIGYSTNHTKMKEEHLSYLRDCEEESGHRDHHHHHHRTVDICIANSFYEKLLPPDLLTVNIFLAEDQLTGGSILSTTSPTKQGVGSDTSKDRGTHSHSSFLTNAFKTTTSSSLLDRSKGDLYGSSDDIPFIRRRMNPKIIPRYLMIVRGKYLFTYDLHKFKRASTHKCLAGYSGKCLSATTVSQKSIIAYKFLSYFKHEKDDDEDGNDDSDDGHSHESILCVSYVNSDGIHGLFATKEKAPLGHHNFLDTILEDHSHLSFGAVLPNGNCYLNDSDRIIYNITTSILNSTYKLNHPLPDRASPDSAAPSRTMMLLSGRESILASKNSLRSKRRSSVIGRISAAAPTDLSLIFRKSMDQRQKEELIGVKGSPSAMEGSDEEGDTFNPSPSSSSGGNRSNWKSSSTTATTKALSTMNDTGLALQERGDRINRLAHQSDDLREGASQFRDNAKKQKEILKKRSSLFSWG